MTYVAACLALYLSHVIPSAPGVRAWLLDLMGPKTFRVVYSLISTATVLWFILTYRSSEPGGQLFVPAGWIIWLALALLPFALFLIVARLGTPFGEIAKPEAVRGIYKVTRFPGSWGVLLWAAVHIGATGDTKRVVAFGTFALIALTALLKNEYVLGKERGVEARVFYDQTGFFPFAEVFAGRQKLFLGELGWKIPLASLLLFIGVLALHPFLFGADPLALLP